MNALINHFHEQRIAAKQAVQEAQKGKTDTRNLEAEKYKQTHEPAIRNATYNILALKALRLNKASKQEIDAASAKLLRSLGWLHNLLNDTDYLILREAAIAACVKEYNSVNGTDFFLTEHEHNILMFKKSAFYNRSMEGKLFSQNQKPLSKSDLFKHLDNKK